MSKLARGFSLVEVLIALAIITMVLAMLANSFSIATKSTQNAEFKAVVADVFPQIKNHVAQVLGNQFSQTKQPLMLTDANFDWSADEIEKAPMMVTIGGAQAKQAILYRIDVSVTYLNKQTQFSFQHLWIPDE